MQLFPFSHAGTWIPHVIPSFPFPRTVEGLDSGHERGRRRRRSGSTRRRPGWGARRGGLGGASHGRNRTETPRAGLIELLSGVFTHGNHGRNKDDSMASECAVVIGTQEVRLHVVSAAWRASMAGSRDQSIMVSVPVTSRSGATCSCTCPRACPP